MMSSGGPGWVRMPRLPAKGLGPVLAVGSRALVTGREPGQRKVALLDAADMPTAKELSVDTEVEVVAWKPRSQAGTRYLVRVVASGAEGWLGTESVRRVVPAARPQRVAEPVPQKRRDPPKATPKRRPASASEGAPRKRAR